MYHKDTEIREKEEKLLFQASKNQKQVCSREKKAQVM